MSGAFFRKIIYGSSGVTGITSSAMLIGHPIPHGIGVSPAHMRPEKYHSPQKGENTEDDHKTFQEPSTC